MNDFTKEELQQIYVHMENEPIEIMNKVKSLIDNYCRHLDSNISFNCEDCGLVL